MKLKPIRELQSFKIWSNPLAIKLKSLMRRTIDFDVYLPTYNMNLQRECVWTIKQKRKLIESMIIDRPIPDCTIMQIYTPELDDDTILVIDGKQRLTSMFDFVENKFSIILEGHELYFKDLPNDYQICIKGYDVRFDNYFDAMNDDMKVTDEDKIEWYERINYFGTAQDEDHINKIKENKLNNGCN